jgi:PAS domain S-box-containing protein
LHQSQKNLRETELWLATTLRSIGDGVISVDLDGRVSFLNAKAELLTGWTMTEARGRPIQEIFSLHHADTGEPLSNPVLQALASGDELMLAQEAVLRQASGTTLPIEDSVAPIHASPGSITGAVVVFRDASARREAEAERRRMQQKLEDSRRLESLGMLASGIAHDFNNLLTAILANVDLGKIDLPASSRALHHLQQIEAAGLRAAELCRQMLAGAGIARRSPTPCDLNLLVEETLRAMRPTLTGQVAIERNLRRDLPRLIADPSQIRQVISNLVSNAHEALEGRPGFVRIRTDIVRATRELLKSAVHGEDLAEGDYLLLEVSDTGCGMSPESLARVCEPFYTTKFMGRGMGMAAVSGIVRAHEGALKIQSEPGQGSVFKLFLPVTHHGT